jgi:MscS family membrane protein
MMKEKTTSIRVLVTLLIVGVIALTACTPDGTEETVSTAASASPERTASPSPDTTALPSPETEATPAEGNEESAGIAAELADAAGTRVPEPTTTPGPVSRGVSELTAATGLTSNTFLGLRTDDWINLGISTLIVLFGYLVGTWTIRRLLPRAVRRTTTQFDDELLKAAGNDLRWLVVLIALNFATVRLVFLRAELKSLFASLYFVVAFVLVMRVTWRLIDLADQVARGWAEREERETQLSPVIDLLVRACRFAAVVAGVSVLLAHFGLDVTAIAAVVGLLGLAIGLAARDTIADIISGIIIFVDQPFRIGDRIEVQAVGTWSDVVQIGLRSTRLVTRDNRMLIIPNSIIGGNEIINYSFPDPTYRVQTDLGVSYDADVEDARRLIIETVRQLEGVMPDKPVDALYDEMGDSAMIFRVRWWIESYAGRRRAIDRAHTALQAALNAAGMAAPFPTQSLDLEIGQDTTERLSETFRELSQEA